MPRSFSGGSAPTQASRYVTSKVIAYDSAETIISATLTKTDNGTIKYFLSADNGLHWIEVTPNVNQSFSYPGKKLVWKAILFSEEAWISDLHVEYTVSS